MARILPNPPSIAQHRSDRILAALARTRRNFAKFGQIWPEVGELWQVLPDIVQLLPDFGNIRAILQRTSRRHHSAMKCSLRHGVLRAAFLVRVKILRAMSLRFAFGVCFGVCMPTVSGATDSEPHMRARSHGAGLVSCVGVEALAAPLEVKP